MPFQTIQFLRSHTVSATWVIYYVNFIACFEYTTCTPNHLGDSSCMHYSSYRNVFRLTDNTIVIIDYRGVSSCSRSIIQCRSICGIVWLDGWFWVSLLSFLFFVRDVFKDSDVYCRYKMFCSWNDVTAYCLLFSYFYCSSVIYTNAKLNGTNKKT